MTSAEAIGTDAAKFSGKAVFYIDGSDRSSAESKTRAVFQLSDKFCIVEKEQAQIAEEFRVWLRSLDRQAESERNAGRERIHKSDMTAEQKMQRALRLS